jgi:MraZ protein
MDYRRSQPEAWNEVMAIASQAVEVKPDKQGRILVPAWLQQAASLDGAVRLVGNIDRIEIWNPAAFDAALSERTEDFRRFASQIFG